MRRWALMLICWLAGACLTQANAAWLQSKGASLIISTLDSYSSDARFDALGRRAPATGYHKQELSVYGVYGLSDALTLGAQPRFFRLAGPSGAGGGRRYTSGLSQLELFVRARILAGDYWIVSTQALVKIPGARAFDREPLLQSSSRDFEGRLLFGHGGWLPSQLLRLKYFTSFEAGYRLRDRNAADQWRADATFGVDPFENYQIIFQSFNTVSAGRRNSAGSSSYDVYKAQISIVRNLPRRMALQFGGFTELAGRNTGAGNAMFVAVWSRF